MADDKKVEAAAVAAAQPLPVPYDATQPALTTKDPLDTTLPTHASDGLGGTTQKENSIEAKQMAQEDDLEATIAHLPEDERQIIRDQLYTPPVKVTYLQLYRFASKFDLSMLFISGLASILGGAVLPLFTVRFTQLFQCHRLISFHRSNANAFLDRFFSVIWQARFKGFSFMKLHFTNSSTIFQSTLYISSISVLANSASSTSQH